MNSFGYSSGTLRSQNNPPINSTQITGIKKIPFNKSKPYKLFIDINSCFATVEQQYNPKLRGKPIAIAAYTGPSGCVIAPSIEAKTYGIKTGMRVYEAQQKYPKLIIMEPDPPKYRKTHQQIKKILNTHTPKVIPKSIDEFVIDIEKTPAQRKGTVQTAKSIKQDIKEQVGEWITVSIGIGPNIFLSKMASELEKPDGLQIINYKNHIQVYSKLKLTDLKGIKSGNASRLAAKNIFTVLDLYNANIETLCSAFKSISGYYWHLRIRGHEIDNTPPKSKKSMGNSYAIPGKIKEKEELAPILYKLVEKTAVRLRKEGYQARGFGLSIKYRDGTSWKDHKTTEKYTNNTQEIYKIFYRLLKKCPHKKPVRILAEACFHLTKSDNKQLKLFDPLENKRKSKLQKTVDKINKKFGDFTIKSGEILKAKDAAPDRIGFGK